MTALRPGQGVDGDCFGIETIGHVFAEDGTLLVEQGAEVLTELGVQLSASPAPWRAIGAHTSAEIFAPDERPRREWLIEHPVPRL